MAKSWGKKTIRGLRQVCAKEDHINFLDYSDQRQIHRKDYNLPDQSSSLYAQLFIVQSLKKRLKLFNWFDYVDPEHTSRIEKITASNAAFSLPNVFALSSA